MPAVSVDHSLAKEILASAWEESFRDTIVPPARLVSQIKEIIHSSDITYKYLLVTGLLGKCTNPKAHPRAIQVSSRLKFSYDARSLCHAVIVGFEKSKGDLWGLSNEPYVNKPARHPEHDKSNPQLRNKKLAAVLHDILEFAHGVTQENSFAMLVYLLRISRLKSEAVPIAKTEETTYRQTVSFTETFLQEAERGIRLVAVVGAFIRLMNQGFDVKIYPPNYSDKFSKTAGDVEIRLDKKLISAFECKHRPITLDDIKHGLRKARENGVSEYSFIFAAGFAPDQEGAVRSEVALQSRQFDVLLVNMFETVKPWAIILNPLRRKQLGKTVTTILAKEMHRIEVAQKAADLWNSFGS